MTSIQTCLLIDDDIDDHEIFAMALQKVDENIELRWAKDGVDGLKTLTDNRAFVPDYIFLDINYSRP